MSIRRATRAATRAISLALVIALAACETTSGPEDIAAPQDLRYRLIPSGDPDAPDGVLLEWVEPNDGRVAAYVIYSRAAASHSWSRRAETTSGTFHDAGIPHLQYYVASVDGEGNESRGSNVVTIDERNRLPAPSWLTSISLDRAIQLAWSESARLTAPALFDYYRVYSTPYDLDANRCDGARWVLEGTTVSEDFLATGLTNGQPRCFAVSTVSTDGHESVWTTPRADTPRHDARNVLVYSYNLRADSSGFWFYEPVSRRVGVVTSGGRTDIHFAVEDATDGSLLLVPVRSDVKVAQYGDAPVEDLTSVDVAPARSSYSRTPVTARAGYAYVFEFTEADGLHYGAVRVTHVSRDYVLLDWSYQSDPGNPELSRGARATTTSP